LLLLLLLLLLLVGAFGGADGGADLPRIPQENPQLLSIQPQMRFPRSPRAISTESAPQKNGS
jgi:hypothetical protein